jgi:hypothetical protein
VKMTQVLEDDQGHELIHLTYDPREMPAGVSGAIGILHSAIDHADRTTLATAPDDSWANVPARVLDGLREASPATSEVLSIELDRGVPDEPDPPPARNTARADDPDDERVPCPNGCGKLLTPGRGTTRHLNNHCTAQTDLRPKQRTPVPPARPAARPADVDGGAVRIECPNGCGKKASAGRPMESHMDRCRLRVP